MYLWLLRKVLDIPELCCKKPVLLDMVLQATFFWFLFFKEIQNARTSALRQTHSSILLSQATRNKIHASASDIRPFPHHLLVYFSSGGYLVWIRGVREELHSDKPPILPYGPGEGCMPRNSPFAHLRRCLFPDTLYKFAWAAITKYTDWLVLLT